MSRAIVESSPTIPSQAELKHTPFFPQEKYQCGPAALATVLHFQDQNTLPGELIDKVYIPEKQGSVPVEMVSTARSYQRLVYPLDASLENLLQEVAAGHPVLVMQNLGFSWQPQWHYAVVIGYDLSEQIVLLRSGREKRLELPLKTFERTWRRANYWALVILLPEQVPMSAQAPRYLKAAQELEETRHPGAAKQAYHAAINRWPDNPLPWLALGNLYFAEKEFELSEKAFRNGLKENPQNGELWNNLGYALSTQGCSLQAQKAIQCAVTLDPDNPIFSHSLEDISSRTMNTSQCAEITCPSVDLQSP